VDRDGGRVAGGWNNEEYLVTKDAISGSICVVG